MDDHRTLDEFGDAPGERDPESTEAAPESAEADAESTDAEPVETGPDATEDEIDGGDEAADDDEADPPATTYRWTPDGAACEDCGATVERRWRDGDAFVCTDCKDW